MAGSRLVWYALLKLMISDWGYLAAVGQVMSACAGNIKGTLWYLYYSPCFEVNCLCLILVLNDDVSRGSLTFNLVSLSSTPSPGRAKSLWKKLKLSWVSRLRILLEIYLKDFCWSNIEGWNWLLLIPSWWDEKLSMVMDILAMLLLCLISMDEVWLSLFLLRYCWKFAVLEASLWSGGHADS